VTTAGAVLDALAQQLRQFGFYGLAFLVTGGLWIEHHQLLDPLETHGRRLPRINLWFLPTVALLPAAGGVAAAAGGRAREQLVGSQHAAGAVLVCGRSREECERLIAGPGVFICDRCVALATGLSAGAAVEGRSAGPMRLEPPGSEVRCSFCGKEARRVRRLVASRLAATPGGKFGQERTRICDECLDLCGEILAETSSP
jgi:hypothetical protein